MRTILILLICGLFALARSQNTPAHVFPNRILCGARCGDGVCKASLSEDTTTLAGSKEKPSGLGNSLAKRTQSNPADHPGGYSQYIIDHALGKLKTDNVEHREGPYGPNGEYDPDSNRPSAKWAQFGDQPYNMMVQGLYGCSCKMLYVLGKEDPCGNKPQLTVRGPAIVVISRLGVYMSKWTPKTCAGA